MSGQALGPTESFPAVQVRHVARFWGRLVAFAADCIILNLICAALGFVFYDSFIRSYRWTAVTGLAINVLYFGVLASSIGGGKTLGHHLLHIEVVQRNGVHLSLGKSLARYLVLFAPWFVPDLLRLGPAAIALGYVVMLADIAIVYLYVFNVRTRQSLHDLAVGSFVVNSRSQGEVKVPAFNNEHWRVLALISVVILAVSAALMPVTWPKFRDLLEIRAVVMKSGRVQDVGIHVRNSDLQGTASTVISLDLLCRGRVETCAQSAREIAAIVLKADRNAMQRQYISFVFREGFQLGFARYWKYVTVTHSPEEWMTIVAQSSSTGL